jgi:hypothetical protein
MLKIGDDLRHGGCGNAELRSGLGHAAALRDGEKYVQVPQSQSATDLTIPVDPLQHSGIP